jgi:hypothetical protein
MGDLLLLLVHVKRLDLKHIIAHAALTKPERLDAVGDAVRAQLALPVQKYSITPPTFS